jgi:cytoskeletal protein CcmA (bactofilin family)
VKKKKGQLHLPLKERAKEMFNDSKPVSVKSEGAETIVGTSVKLKGNLHSSGDIIVDGSVSGELKTKGSVIVGPNANILANIKAQNVQISGMVQGNIEASDKIQITETGRVVGDISAAVLNIAPGAIFSGNSKMNDTHREVSPEPVMEETASTKKEEKSTK